METKKSKFNLGSFMKGFNKGKKIVIEKIEKFINEECEFIPDITSDMLLDRLASIIKKL